MKIEPTANMLVLRRIDKKCLPDDEWDCHKTDSLYWLALDDDGAVMGFLAVEPAEYTPDAWFITRVCVLPEYSGRKIAQHLLRWLVVEAKSRGIPQLVTYVVAWNGASIASFVKAGYTIYSPDDWYMPGGGVVYFQKALR